MALPSRARSQYRFRCCTAAGTGCIPQWIAGRPCPTVKTIRPRHRSTAPANCRVDTVDAADSDGWVYVTPELAAAYLEALDRHPELLQDHDADRPTDTAGYLSDDIRRRFASGSFEPFDAISISVPYAPEIADEIASHNAILLEIDRYYSGLRVLVEP